MNMRGEDLRFLMGLKLKQLRQDRGYSSKEFANKSGLSLSYLSEIEKGKKYPTPEKILQIAKALEVSFDELVSTKVDEERNPLTAILQSPLMKEFPFQFFGIAPHDVVNLVTHSPQEAGALLRTLLEIGRAYDMRVEQFLFAALRSYQKMHNNYFEEIEQAAAAFMAEQRWKPEPPLSSDRLKSVLIDKFGYELDETTLNNYPELKGFRSIWIDGKRPKLLLNGRLLPSQKAFLLGREIGFCYLHLDERPVTSSWLKVESFEQVLNNFKASYFSGAMFINRDLLREDLTRFFQNERWDGEAFLALMRRYDATPEMFLYRLSQLIPKLFDLQEMFYLRFNNEAGSDRFFLTKELNMSRVTVPHGIGLNEHYCRRWLSTKLLKDLAERQKHGDRSRVALGGDKEALLIDAQRSRFIDSDAEFLVITLARPLVLTEGTNSSITLGFLINDAFKKVVRFWNDPAISRIEVNETCERCSLSEIACRDRVAPPVIFQKQQNQKTREKVLHEVLEKMRK
jgi:hypothetical protein